MDGINGRTRRPLDCPGVFRTRGITPNRVSLGPIDGKTGESDLDWTGEAGHKWIRPFPAPVANFTLVSFSIARISFTIVSK